MSKALIIAGVVVAGAILAVLLFDNGTERETLIALTAFTLGCLVGHVAKKELWVWVKTHGKTK